MSRSSAPAAPEIAVAAGIAAAAKSEPSRGTTIVVNMRPPMGRQSVGYHPLTCASSRAAHTAWSREASWAREVTSSLGKIR